MGFQADRMQVEAGGRIFQFWHPKTVYMKNLVTGILKGHAYPMAPLPGFRPESILDIGANIGAAALYFHLHYPEARIHCYEPSSDNLAYLSKNLGSMECCKIHPFGLYDKTVRVPLYAGKDIPAQNAVTRTEETADRGETVQLISTAMEMDRLGGVRPSIVKIDTEGCEVPILSGLQPHLGRIDMIYLEYHSERDRLDIDRMISSCFFLLHSRASGIHPGTILYAAKSLIERYPRLSRTEITRPCF